jgi:hypothetical protein
MVLKWAIMNAECAGVSGPGYYATGPRLDVQDVPAKSQASFRPVDVTGLSNQRLGMFTDEAQGAACNVS